MRKNGVFDEQIDFGIPGLIFIIINKTIQCDTMYG